MPAVIVNTVLVLLGSFIGILFRNKISERFTSCIIAGMAICVMVIGIQSAIGTNNILIVIICIVLGTIIGELLRIEDKLNNCGEYLKSKLFKKSSGGRFVEGFVSASLLFCVGSMAVMGSLDAGISHNYSIIFAKSIIDFVSAIILAASMGVGVAFSAVFVFVYQGLLTLLAGLVGPLLSADVVAEMNATGGIILIGIGINMLDIAPGKIKPANMLPAIFLPLLYFPIVNFVSGLF